MVIKSMNTETMANNTISLRDLKQQGGGRGTRSWWKLTPLAV